MAIPLLEARDLVKEFALGGDIVRAVNHVSLTIERGEFVAIIGGVRLWQVYLHEHARLS